ncbi:MAG TPA: hypothetical protein VGJ56_27955 [Reyranella sp.]|jgi:hypothetical protein
MRWIVLGLAALVIAACSQAGNLHNQIVWTGGVGYDVRAVTASGGPPTYEATASYTTAHASERPHILKNLLYRGVSKVGASHPPMAQEASAWLARLKADGAEG